jgi:predicted histidine transporter YuiF (NhaC family)
MMRISSIIVALLIVAVVIVCGYHVYVYLTQAKNLPKEQEDQDDWKAAVNQARRLRFGELPVCWILLPCLCALFAKLKAPTRISWLRNTVAILFAFAWLFVVTTFLMHATLAEHNAAYILPPAAIWDAMWWAAASLVVGSVILFGIERIYVKEGVAPDA